MLPLEVFLWGLGGSLAVEIVTVNKYMNSESSLPPRYKNFGFWLARLSLAFVGGGLAVAYGIDKALLAANVGAATPLIVNALAQGLTPEFNDSGLEFERKTERKDVASEAQNLESNHTSGKR